MFWKNRRKIRKETKRKKDRKNIDIQKIDFLSGLIDELLVKIEKSNFMQWSYILNSKKEILKRNVLAGIGRGIGFGVGFTIITALIVVLLQQIVTLNIPIIGSYIADIVEIVENSR